MDEIKLTDLQRDAMQEVSNIGASHAATALSQMVFKDIEIGIPKINIIPIEDTIECVITEEIAVGIFLKIADNFPTYILLLLPFDSALNMSAMLMGNQPDPYKADLDEMEKSAMQEVGNIMMTSFFDSISELIGLSLVPGPPTVACDMPVAIMDFIIAQLGEVASKVVVFDIELNDEKNNNFKIDILLMPEPKAIEMILEKIGMTGVRIINFFY